MRCNGDCPPTPVSPFGELRLPPGRGSLLSCDCSSIRAKRRLPPDRLRNSDGACDDGTLWSMSLIGCCIVAALWILPPVVTRTACDKECGARYSSDIDDCQTQFGDNPADTNDLANCIEDAREMYRHCLDDCSSDTVFHMPCRSRASKRPPQRFKAGECFSSIERHSQIAGHDDSSACGNGQVDFVVSSSERG